MERVKQFYDTLLQSAFIDYIGLIALVLLFLWLLLFAIYGKKWKRRFTLDFFVGPGLVKSSRKLAGELPGNVQKETLGEVAAQVFKRLTRIGLIGLGLAIIPIWLLINQNWLLGNQNQLLERQNKKIDDQNYLMESQRRSSLVLLMSNVLTDLSREIERQTEGLSSEELEILDSVGYHLSDPLIGRIASLSQGLLPYRFLVGSVMMEKEYSVERGQLLLAIVNSNLNWKTYNKIYNKSTFEKAYLRGAKLREAIIFEADLSGVDLSGADLTDANLFATNLEGANLERASLNLAILAEVNLKGANLSKSNFNGVDLNLADLRETNLYRFWVPTVEKLSKAYSLDGCRNLDPELEEKLCKISPCLFEGGCD